MVVNRLSPAQPSFLESRSVEGDFVTDCAWAVEHPAVGALAALCDSVRGDTVLSFEMLQERAFMPYWRGLMIQRWDESRGDFVFVFFGTALVRAWGRDCTGCTLADSHGNSAQAARAIALRALRNHETVCYSGSMGWEERSFIRFVGIAMPIQRKGIVGEVAAWSVLA